MKNLTPKAMRCTFGGCPAVYELDDGRLLVVGRIAEPHELAGTTGGIGDDEEAIIIDGALLADVLATTTPAAT